MSNGSHRERINKRKADKRKRKHKERLEKLKMDKIYKEALIDPETTEGQSKLPLYRIKSYKQKVYTNKDSNWDYHTIIDTVNSYIKSFIW